MIAADVQGQPTAEPAATAGSTKPTGTQLVAAFPPRPVAASWPATGARRSAVVDRVLAAPFALDNPLSQRNRRLGLLAVLGWLREQPGDSWQQRWARQRRRGPARLAAAGRHRPRQTAAAPDPRAADADMRRCDPAQPGLAAAVHPGAAQPGRRDGPHPRPPRSPSSPRCVRAESDCNASSRR